MWRAVFHRQSGNRRILSDFSNASQGVSGTDPFGVAVNADGSILMTGCTTATPDAQGICRVDRNTGVRQLLSDFGAPAQGPVGLVPLTLAIGVQVP